MENFLIVPLVILINVFFAQGVDRPPYIDACHTNDPNLDECAIASAKRAIPEIAKGDPVYNIPKMNPMHLDAIDLAISHLSLSLKNVTVHGLETTRPTNFHFNLTTRDLYFEFFVPLLDIAGQYNLSGSLLVFPIQGNGLANIKYVNGTYKYKVHFEVITKKSVNHLNITKHSLKLECDRAYYKFTNLFNGNKVLGDQIQQFMDENWKDVNKDFAPLLEQAIDSIAYYTSNAIFLKVPYEQIFLP